MCEGSFLSGRQAGKVNLGALSADTASQLDILGHDGHTFGVDGAQVGIFEETHQVSLAGFLQSHDSRALEAQVSLEVLCNLTNQTLERQLADEQLSALLVTTDLTKSDGTGPVTMGFLDTTSGWRALTSGLGSQLLARSLASGRFTCGLLSSCHCDRVRRAEPRSAFYNRALPTRKALTSFPTTNRSARRCAQ